ncbi:MAG TPA: T9SS type A sorting domain-containing protein, partial [Bacteroidales bacterium]|nr:T9SS type A sorting domain-containing protein [Bacteroidales bacterium]
NAGNAGSTYLWSTGATTQVITVDTTGLGTGTFTFSVTVTSNLGCQASDAVQVTFDPCVGLPETWVTELEVYPNPNQGRFDIRLTTPYPSHSQLWLTNALGEMVWNTGIEGPQSAQAYSVSLPALPAGVYFLRYSSGESTLTRKVVIQH